MEDPSVARLAQTVMSGGRNPAVRVPPQPVPSLRMASVSAVNATDSNCSVTIGGSSTVIPNVMFMPHYVPQVGDMCWVFINDKDIMVIGQHAAPTPPQWP